METAWNSFIYDLFFHYHLCLFLLRSFPLSPLSWQIIEKEKGTKEKSWALRLKDLNNCWPIISTLSFDNVESCCSSIESSRMRWLGYLVRIPPGRLPGEAFLARPDRRRSWGRPRTYVSHLAWGCLGIPLEYLDNMTERKEVWASLLMLLPPWPNPV